LEEQPTTNHSQPTPRSYELGYHSTPTSN